MIEQAKQLNHLILEADEHTNPGRGQICLEIDPAAKSASSVSVRESGKPWSFSSLLSRSDKKRRILVHTGQSVAMPDIEVSIKDIASEVDFKVHLALDLQTPANTDEADLRQIAFAFRGCSLERQGKISGNNLSMSVASTLRNELGQWLYSRYHTASGSASYADSDWLRRENETIKAHIRREYGLIAAVKLKILVAPELRLGPIYEKVTTSPSNSNVEVIVPIKIGCRLTRPDVFTGPVLTEADFKNRVNNVTARYVRENVSLQEFRFDKDWIEGLRKAIASDLERFSREMTDFLVEHSDRVYYERGPHPVEAGEARFIPAGWENQEAIVFKANAKIEIADAALFESRHFEGQPPATDAVQRKLADWLKSALQSAVSNCLHDIHDSDKGYAQLLQHWTDTYRPNIENTLMEMAKAEGLTASAIIAKPDREEMKLLTGAPLQLRLRDLPALDPNATVSFDADIEIMVNAFSDIAPILNRTHRPMEHIEQQIIVPALERAIRQIGWIEFMTRFDQDDFDQNQSKEASRPAYADPLSPVSRMEIAVAEALKDEGVMLKKSIAVHRIDNEKFNILRRLQSHPSVRVVTEVPEKLLPDSVQQVSDSQRIEFNLRIDNLHINQFSQFFRLDWQALAAQHGEEFLAVAHRVGEDLGKRFLREDLPAIRDADFSEESGADFSKLINMLLDELLGQEFGLSGTALTPHRQATGELKVVIAQRSEKLESLMLKTALEGESTRALIRTREEARREGAKAAFKHKYNDSQNESEMAENYEAELGDLEISFGIKKIGVEDKSEVNNDSKKEEKGE